MKIKKNWHVFLASINLILLFGIALWMIGAPPSGWELIEKMGAGTALFLLIIGGFYWPTLVLILSPSIVLIGLQRFLWPELSSQVCFTALWLNSFLSMLTYAFTHKKEQTYTGRLFALLALIAYSTGFIIRWQESYRAHIPHLPMSTLYEVLLLLTATTLCLYLYIEDKIRKNIISVYALGLVCLIHLFTIWYAYTHNAYLMTPTIPALQSYWLSIHVPMNFIGYALFGLASVSSLAYLYPRQNNRAELNTIIVHCIRWGLIFFSIAIVLGALWAAETWGSYWQWDPKETWALIVWFNYAAWLHAQRTRLSEKARIWWSALSFFIMTFAFLGVNIFLSGLHSYGKL